MESQQTRIRNGYRYGNAMLQTIRGFKTGKHLDREGGQSVFLTWDNFIENLSEHRYTPHTHTCTQYMYTCTHVYVYVYVYVYDVYDVYVYVYTHIPIHTYTLRQALGLFNRFSFWRIHFCVCLCICVCEWACHGSGCLMEASRGCWF